MSLPPIRCAPLVPFLRGCSFFKALKGDGGTLEEIWTGIFLSPELSFTLHFLCSFSSGALGGHFNPHLGPRMNLKARQLPLFSAASISPPTPLSTQLEGSRVSAWVMVQWFNSKWGRK